ncbi:Uncharacterized protein SCF082_LOCUS27165 [Durusdinium trenchii]|uniref:Uncharacterized protein n=1 Tax=Durusdinium trenchii TaxID=1381693 RepID=A0ABP0MBL8_9DINO
MNYRDGHVENLEKLPVQKANLFYLSCHTLDGASFGKARICRALTDKWLSNEMSFAGVKFDPCVPELSEHELKQIPGCEAVLQSADTLVFEVLVRRGSSFVINPDQERKWSSLATTADQFEQLKNDHHCRYKDALASVAKFGSTSATSASTPAAPVPVAAPSVDEEDECEPKNADGSGPRQFESMEALKGSTKVVHEVASDIPGVKVLTTEAGQVILYSDSARQLSKGQQLGGFGSGQYVPSGSGVEGVALTYEQGDKTKVQVEESSIRRDSSATPVMTLYQLLVLVERTFKVNAHKISYSEVERAADDSGRDTFKVKLTKAMIFKFLDDDREEGGEAHAKKPKKAVTGKSVFRYTLPALEKSSYIQTTFRYRYEKIGQSLKLMKPYVILSQNVKLEAKKPMEACFLKEKLLLFN